MKPKTKQRCSNCGLAIPKFQQPAYLNRRMLCKTCFKKITRWNESKGRGRQRLENMRGIGR